MREAIRQTQSVHNADVSNRPVALITGASSGLGSVFARKLAARGYDLMLVARREERLRALAAELNCRSEILVADLSTDDGVASVERAIARCERLELLVNNAGFGTMGRFWEADIDGQVGMQKVHILAMMRLAHAALRVLVPKGSNPARHSGIINVASVAAFGQSPGNTGYCAAKAWIVSFTEGLDMELRGIGSKIRVQALCPGFTLTEFHEVIGVDRGMIPGWLWLKAEDVVEDSLVAMETSGKVAVIPGWQYKIATFLMKHLPHELKRHTGRPGGKRV